MLFIKRKQKNTKIIHFLFALSPILFLLLSVQELSAVPLPPKQKRQTETTQQGIIKQLLPDKSIAPKINGKLLKKPSKKFRTIKQFDKNLKKYSVNYKNKITILLFWKKNCGFSQMILPKINLIHKRFKKKGVNIYAVNSHDLSNKSDFIDFLNKYKYIKPVLNENKGTIKLEVDSTQKKSFDVPILFITEKTKNNFLVTALPTTYVIDEDGLVYTAMFGFFKEYDLWLTFLLENMLGDPKKK